MTIVIQISFLPSFGRAGGMQSCGVCGHACMPRIYIVFHFMSMSWWQFKFGEVFLLINAYFQIQRGLNGRLPPLPLGSG